MSRIEKLIPLVKPFYPGTDPAHDWAHIERVAKCASAIAEENEMDLVLAAVYCHDLVNVPKDHPDRANASVLSAEKAHPLLKSAGFLQNEISAICTGIIEHSYSRGLIPSNKIAAIVQDADRIDALGAIGILRCAAVNARMQSAFYDPADPLSKTRELDDRRFMLDHYFLKLLKLPEKMNTEKGKTLALQRAAYMKDFIEQLLLEIR